jgi:hypothetical protein
MNRFAEIEGARLLLELPELATMKEIKAAYRRLLRKWHPDRCGPDPERCAEMTRKVVEAYRTLAAYCRDYRFSFSREEVKQHLSAEEWWMEKFGNDPLWGDLKNQR